MACLNIAIRSLLLVGGPGDDIDWTGTGFRAVPNHEAVVAAKIVDACCPTQVEKQGHTTAAVWTRRRGAHDVAHLSDGNRREREDLLI